MTDLRYALSRLRRMTLIEWTHGLLGGGALVVWAILLFGGAP